MLLYKAVVKQVSIYNIEFWGCDTNDVNVMMHMTQIKILTTIGDAPWFINNMIHKNLSIPLIMKVIRARSFIHRDKIDDHYNKLVHCLLAS